MTVSGADALLVIGLIALALAFGVFVIILRRIPAYIMGIGVQREHVRTPDAGHG